MDLELKLALDPIADRARKQLDYLQTEAATSTALVLPFLAALGYDVFNPAEVVPEFTADFGGKKGEKVDYAVMNQGQPRILVEVKCWNVDLGRVHESQLYRYFSVTTAKISILTNGIFYKFFADTESANKMDEKPFFEFDIRNMKKADYDALRQFSKGSFDDDNIVTAAQELLFTRGIVSAMHSEFASPSDDFVRYFTKIVYSGMLGKNAKELFSKIVKRAQQQFLTEFFTKFSDNVTSAINREATPMPQGVPISGSSAIGTAPTPDAPAPAPTIAAPPSSSLTAGLASEDDEVVTTAEEREGYDVVKAIMSSVVDVSRVVMRDTKSYCGILLDDNNRKPICRLRFNTAQKSLGVFDALKNEERIAINQVAEIYMHAERLRAVAQFYRQGLPA